MHPVGSKRVADGTSSGERDTCFAPSLPLPPPMPPPLPLPPLPPHLLPVAEANHRNTVFADADALVDRGGAGCRAERRARCSPSGGHRAARCGSARRCPERSCSTTRVRGGEPVRTRRSLSPVTPTCAGIPCCATQASPARASDTSCACAWARTPAVSRTAGGRGREAASDGPTHAWIPTSSDGASRCTCQCTPAGPLAQRAGSPRCSAGTTLAGSRYGSSATWTWTWT